MSDTPRTDAQKRGDFVHINFARELERENAALREQKESLIRQRNDASKLYFTAQQVEIPALLRENAALKIERNRLRVVLQDIADASGFDHIGNWARNKAKEALSKEAQP